MTKPEALGLNENAEVEKNNKMCERFLDVSSRNNRLNILKFCVSLAYMMMPRCWFSDCLTDATTDF